MMKNKHITHLEDLLIQEKPINGLIKIYEICKDLNYKNVQIKWDGSPSIVIGTDPTTSKHFVSTKSYFNKTPKFYTCGEDLYNSNLSTSLQFTFKHILDNWDIPDNVIQGDLLDNVCEHEGKFYAHPNTLMYDCSDWPAGKIAVAWHTKYNSDIEASCIDKLIPSSDYMYSVSPFLNKAFPSSAIEDKKYFDMYSLSRNITIPSNLIPHIKMYINYVIKNEIQELNTHTFLSWLIHKSYRTKMYKVNIIENVICDNYDAIHQLFLLISHISDHKVSIIDCINNTIDDKIYVMDKFYNLIPSNHEGFVYSNGSDLIKLVNRREFSYNNFSSTIRKGWTASRR